ncbi:exosortase-dependent surface protein XDP1 [Alishewanella sp. HL-SH05]|uniref:exosortase-dependent surface protein XDP1 n=1 Tax=Alishewanella sp. HL-SH05 TaxID=3461145 RepID=UPI004041C21D
MLSAIKKITFGVLCSAALLSTSVLASTATSTTETWSFKPATTTTVKGANTITLTSDLGTNALISGWSSNSKEDSAIVMSARKLTLSETHGVQVYSHADTNNSPDHAVDNNKGFDFILLEFPNPVELLSLTNTWSQIDSDVSVGAFNSNPFANTSPTWQQVANSAIQTASYTNTYTNTISSSPYIFANKTSIVSSENIVGVSGKFWLIGAYNAAFNGAGCTITCFNDAMKFGSITTKLAALPTSPDNAQDVPLPGTLSLFAAGIFGLMYRNRRRTQR